MSMCFYTTVFVVVYVHFVCVLCVQGAWHDVFIYKDQCVSALNAWGTQAETAYYA